MLSSSLDSHDLTEPQHDLPTRPASSSFADGKCTRQILVPLRLDAMRRELTCYVAWYNEHRPSQALSGRTPWEAYEDLRPANTEPRFEARPNWPTDAPCASSRAAIRGNRGMELSLIVGLVDSKKHLPVVALRKAA